LAACDAQGGGFLDSAADNGAKASFGFTVRCDPTTHQLSGQFQYVDKAAGLSIHGTISSAPFCNPDATPNPLTFGGTYTTQGRQGAACSGSSGSGGFTATVFHAGSGAPPKGDTLSMSLTSGPCTGYANSGPVQGGNIQVS